MTKLSVAEARNNLSELIRRALAGEEIVITRHGAPVAELRPLRAAARPMTEADLDRFRRARVGSPGGPDAGELLKDLRESDDQRLFRR